MSGFALKAVVIVIVIALIGVIAARAFRRVRPSKPAAAAPPAKAGTLSQRMPVLLLPLAGAVLVVAGFFLGLISFTSRYTADLLPLRIAAVVLFVAGIGVLLVGPLRRRGR
ncbi:hypothetical protein LC082_08240 [Microbacterium esteraromaticum]|uniref:hypothetical protein n=1 Tax=Microbacterium esteraromaticum TaxID=57043 RepID=UPI001CD3F0FC|nr:hypothetical protein [Microbacterium esteraromaticum]MCA1306885.1 hypothetical protein [Microbacterium esteraromaticum]